MTDFSVLLVHGLAESAAHFIPMSASLELSGYQTHILNYPSTKYPVEDLAEHYLGPAIRAQSDHPVLHIITHSLGGILLRYYLQNHSIENLGRIVMLAPPNSGSPPYSLYRHHPLFPLIMGPAGNQIAADDNCVCHTLSDRIEQRTGIIAACIAFDPMSYFLMPWPHDGRTTVEGTKLTGTADHITLPVEHTQMLFDPMVWYQARCFLQNEHFHHTAVGRPLAA